MCGVIARLFHEGVREAAAERLDRAYVSEYTDFMNRFLREHPEVVEDQWVGRALYWDRNVDFRDQERAQQDRVPDDCYGFSPSAWAREPASLSANRPRHQ